jgi:hypothetical protein
MFMKFARSFEVRPDLRKRYNVLIIRQLGLNVRIGVIWGVLVFLREPIYDRILLRPGRPAVRR